MKQFGDNIPGRAFDNFQFVNFTNLMSRNMLSAHKEAAFASEALVKIPAQYKATKELGILNRRTGSVWKGLVRPPPPCVYSTIQVQRWTSSRSTSDMLSESLAYVSCGWKEFCMKGREKKGNLASQICPICLEEPKDMAFQCGHQVWYTSHLSVQGIFPCGKEPPFPLYFLDSVQHHELVQKRHRVHS